jgi:2',3'-cyclic-nucleotide 2'-phosphodiesterase (5'-nucleotidase family)
MLENGVSAMPAANGRFPQVSGLCFTYDVAAPTGASPPAPAFKPAVTAAVFANPDGTCTGAPVDLTAGSTYTVAVNDFMAMGGDGYPNLVSVLNSPEVRTMADVLADYIEAAPTVGGVPTISPAFQNRITCTDSNGGTAPNCPAFVP